MSEEEAMGVANCDSNQARQPGQLDAPTDGREMCELITQCMQGDNVRVGLFVDWHWRAAKFRHVIGVVRSLQQFW
jgi:hypothetical protein